MSPIPANTAQLSRQLGAALASVCAASMYAARASRGIVPEPDHAGTAGDNVGAACTGTPTDAGWRATAGTSQVAGAIAMLGLICGSAENGDSEDAVAGYVMAPVSAVFETGTAAAFATRGRCGKPPVPCWSTNAATKKAIAALMLQACARGRGRLAPACRPSTGRTACFEILTC
jgi:hypothetical protein